MAITFITSYLTEIRALLMEQFKNKQNLTAFATPFATQYDDLEDVFQDLLEKRDIDNAEGDQLDLIGALVGQPRGGLSDANYRIAIRLRITANVSCGEPETLITIAKAITAASIIKLFEKFQGCVNIWTDGAYLPTLENTEGDPMPELIVPWINQLQRIAPAGVHVALVTTQGETPFVFGPDKDSGGGDHGAGDPDGEGYGDPGFLEDGQYADAISVPIE